MINRQAGGKGSRWARSRWQRPESGGPGGRGPGAPTPGNRRDFAPHSGVRRDPLSLPGEGENREQPRYTGSATPGPPGLPRLCLPLAGR